MSAVPSTNDLVQQYPPLVTKKTAAEMLACCERQIDRFRDSGELRAVGLGRAVRIETASILAFINRNRLR